jgi:uncharacterized protein with HEPN domain
MIKAIETFSSLEIKSLEEFETDSRTQDTVMFNLIILGEAANGLSDEFIENHNNIPWNDVIGMRNIIVHGYDILKTSVVWDIIINDLPTLEQQLRKFV